MIHTEYRFYSREMGWEKISDFHTNAPWRRVPLLWDKLIERSYDKNQNQMVPTACPGFEQKS
jgi:hypothetical protein